MAHVQVIYLLNMVIFRFSIAMLVYQRVVGLWLWNPLRLPAPPQKIALPATSSGPNFETAMETTTSGPITKNVA